MSHARRSLAIFALLLGTLGVLAGCGGSGESGASGAGERDRDPVADTAPCERLTLDMAKAVLRSPKIEKPQTGVYGCSLRVVSTTVGTADDPLPASLSLAAPQTPTKDGAPVPSDVDEMREETEKDADYTTRNLAVGTDGWISYNNKLGAAIAAWADEQHTYLLNYTTWESPQQGKVPVDKVIAIAKEIAGE